MEIGVVILPTDRSAQPVELVEAVEQRGLDALLVGEHTHIPASRSTPFIMGDPLPDEYTRTFDPVVALAAMASRSSRVRLGTCIALLAQRDPILTAKSLASIDVVSEGRLEVGVGYGWNVEEAANHGVDWSTRRARLHETVDAMRLIWTDDEAEIHGDHVDFDPVWSWPKPVQTTPPILLGCGPGPRNFAAIVERFDGWYPVPFSGHTPADVERLRQTAADADRDPASIAIHVDGVLADPALVDPWFEIGADRVLVPLPSLPLGELEPILDGAAGLADRYR